MAPSSLKHAEDALSDLSDRCDRDCDGVEPPGWKAYWLSATSD